jgi:hypothetical protein
MKTEATLAALVDEYAELREKVKQWKPNVNPHLARFEELEVAILAAHEKEPADQAIIAQGAKFKLPISARQVQRSIKNLSGFYRLVGVKQFLSICSVTLGSIEKEIPKEQRKRFIASAQTGRRTIGEPVLQEQA